MIACHEKKVEKGLQVRINLISFVIKIIFISVSFIVYSSSHNLFLLLFNFYGLQDKIVLFKYRVLVI